jgi:hypothetical protein
MGWWGERRAEESIGEWGERAAEEKAMAATGRERRK